jgi:hypothetical protein
MTALSVLSCLNLDGVDPTGLLLGRCLTSVLGETTPLAGYRLSLLCIVNVFNNNNMPCSGGSGDVITILLLQGRLGVDKTVLPIHSAYST